MRVLYGPETAFLITREGRAFLKEDAIKFFIGATDPGNFTTFLSEVISQLFLFYYVSFRVFSKLCNQLQPHPRERGE